MLTKRFSGTWSDFLRLQPAAGLTVDYTGNIYGPMLLPLQPRKIPEPGESPVWRIKNYTAHEKAGRRVGTVWRVKNLLNFLPPKNSIAHAHDPFDKRTGYNADGSMDLYNLLFDPTYVFAPNQGIRGFIWAQVYPSMI